MNGADLGWGAGEEFEFVADAVSGVGRMVGEEAAVSVALEVSPRVGDLV